jgi:UDP-glucose 4-epimerase
VRGVDNFSTGRQENIADIESRMDFREADILDEAAMASACQGIDYVLHEAAIPSVPKSVADPYGSNRAGVDGTLNMLIKARDAGVKRFVYAASSSAYGETPTLPKREDMATHPISPYAVAKLAGEMYASVFYRCYGLETVALRYFNVFGPRQDPGSPYSAVLAKFITLMLEGKRPTMYGDGEQSRDFTYIDNVIEANLRACVAPAERCAGQVMNAACGRSVSLNQIYRLLQELTGFSGEPIYAAERAGDIKHSLADNSTARDAIGYIPLVTFEDGLRLTVSWYRDEMRRAAGTSAP